MSDQLPIYKSKATPQQRLENLQWMQKQVKSIKVQEKNGVSVSNIQVPCDCDRKVNYLYMYRCLYCGIFFCKTCAEEHFGMKVPEHMKGVG